MDWWNGLSVLVTGGTGSFGRRCIQALLRDHHPARVAVFSRDELKQHEMRCEPWGMDPRLRYFIGDVRDADRLRRAFDGIDVVIHAAALKQVPSCEYNPGEAIRTNVDGAQNVVDAAIDRNVGRVIALSTDKAVNPVNLYGATKLCAEKVFVQGNAYSGHHSTRFACVRYGNVIGSRGSVVPLWQQQRDAGKISVTDPQMTRFWLPLGQAVRFVLESVWKMHGGEVFVPKLLSCTMRDLADAVAPGCEQTIIGIRAGEKMDETLVSADESWHTLELADRYIIQPLHAWWDETNWSDAKLMVDHEGYNSLENPYRVDGEKVLSLLEEDPKL